ncbi:MAG: hypothetical protein AB1416_13615 [Actinomycetota bacterium]
MDLNRLSRALRRYWLLLVIGLVAGVGLGGLTYLRTETIYQSDSTIFVTQSGFPWGRTILDPDADPSDSRFGDSSRFTELAALYSRLAGSDVVRTRVLEQGPINGKVFPALLLSADQPGAGPLPLLRIRALAPSKEGAVALATRWTDAFRTYITSEQKRGGIPARERVLLEPVQVPKLRDVEVFRARSLTRPVAIVLAVMILVLGLILLLDNARRGRLAAAAAAGDGPRPDAGGVVTGGDGTEAALSEEELEAGRRGRQWQRVG